MSYRFSGFVIAAVLIAATFANPRSAQSSPLTFSFEGTFESQFGLADFPLVGAAISGFYTFEAATPDVSTNPAVAMYDGALSALSGTVVYNLGQSFFNFSATDGDIAVANNAVSFASHLSRDDVYQVRVDREDGLLGPPLGLFPTYLLERFTLQMVEATGNNEPTALNNTALPLTPLHFGVESITLRFAADHCCGEGWFTFNLTDSALIETPPAPVPVPEPGTLALMSLGIMAAAARRRRRIAAPVKLILHDR